VVHLIAEDRYRYLINVSDWKKGWNAWQIIFVKKIEEKHV